MFPQKIEAAGLKVLLVMQSIIDNGADRGVHAASLTLEDGLAADPALCGRRHIAIHEPVREAAHRLAQPAVDGVALICRQT